MEQPFNIFEALSIWDERRTGSTFFWWLVATDDLPDEDLDEVFSEYLIDQHLAGPEAVRVTWDMALPQFQVDAPAS